MKRNGFAVFPYVGKGGLLHGSKLEQIQFIFQGGKLSRQLDLPAGTAVHSLNGRCSVLLSGHHKFPIRRLVRAGQLFHVCITVAVLPVQRHHRTVPGGPCKAVCSHIPDIAVQNLHTFIQ